MSIHIGAKPGEVAPTVLLPGDPLRAKHIAETMLEDAVCYNEVRGMLGYTGHYEGKRVSVMGSGMGMPTLSIYVHELVTEYYAETLIRVGTCGALRPDLRIGEPLHSALPSPEIGRGVRGDGPAASCFRRRCGCRGTSGLEHGGNTDEGT